MKLNLKSLLLYFGLACMMIGCSKSENLDPYISVGEGQETSVNASQDGVSAEFTFKTNQKWSVSSNQSWVSVTPTSGEAGECTITITVAANEGMDKRDAKVTINASNVSLSLVVIQNQKDAFIIAPDSFDLTYESQNIEVELTSNVADYDIAFSGDWIKPISTKSTFTKKVSFNVAANTGDARTGSITFSKGAVSESIEINQGPSPLAGGGIFFAGVMAEMGANNIGYVWYNGKMVYQINDGVSDRVSMADIAVTDDGVYTIGYRNDDKSARGFIWKNDEAIGEFASPTGYMNPSGLLAYNKELYTSGYYYNEDWDEEGYVWKGTEKAFHLVSPYASTPAMLPDAIAEYNGDLYTSVEALRNIDSRRAETPLIYKNDELLYTLDTKGEAGSPEDICVHNGDVYTAGYFRHSVYYPEYDDYSRYMVACVWKNDQLLYILGDESAEFNSEASGIVVDENGDIYVCGYLKKNRYNVATVWKNGEILYQFDTNEYPTSEPHDIMLYEGKCYVCGDMATADYSVYHAVVWCDGKVLYEFYPTDVTYPFATITCMTSK